MKSRISIKIEKPCYEDWEQMTPTEQARPDGSVGRGKFCSACRKNVIDFSKMTDNEILAFLSEHTGSLCGQLRGSQLNRVITPTKLTADNWRLNSALTALLLVGGAGFANAQAPLPIPVPMPPDAPNVQKLKYTVCPIEDSPTYKENMSGNILKAQVIDTVSGEPMAYATVQIAGTDHKVSTDSSGYFTLEIPATEMTDTITLLISSPGYFRQQFIFASANISSITTIEVALHEIMMKGEIILKTDG